MNPVAIVKFIIRINRALSLSQTIEAGSATSGITPFKSTETASHEVASMDMKIKNPVSINEIFFPEDNRAIAVISRYTSR
jgi:hypothetical protein